MRAVRSHDIFAEGEKAWGEIRFRRRAQETEIKREGVGTSCGRLGS